MDYFNAIFTFLIGIAAVYAGLRTLKLSKRTKHWEKIQVQISKIYLAQPKRPRRNLKVILAEYTYQANGMNYTGKTVYSMELIGVERGMLPNMAQKEIERISQSSEGWYNPANPSESFLTRFNPVIYRFLIPLGILMVLGSLVWLLNRIV